MGREEEGLLPHTETPKIPFLSQQKNLVKLLEGTTVCKKHLSFDWSRQTSGNQPLLTLCNQQVLLMSRGRGKKDPVQLCRGSLVIIYRSPPQNSPPNEARHAETSALNTKGHGGWHCNCALHFNSSLTPGNQSGRSTETLTGNAPNEARMPQAGWPENPLLLHSCLSHQKPKNAGLG